MPEEELVAPAEVLDLGGCENAVRDRDDRAVESSYARRVERDVLDLALDVPDADGLADAEDLVGQHEESAEEVFEAALRREGNREAADPDSGQSRREIDAKSRERGEDGDENDGPLEDTAPDREGGGRGRAGSQEAHRGARRQQTDDADEKPCETGDDDEPGASAIVVPAEEGKADRRDGEGVERDGGEECERAAERDETALESPREGSPRERAAREAENTRDEEAREEPRDRNQRPEREDLPEAERARYVAAEERGHPPVELGRRQVAEGGRNLAEGLRADEPDRRPFGGSRLDEQEIEGVVSGLDVSDQIAAGREGVVEGAGRRAAQLFEIADEALVEERLELAGELLTGNLAALRPLEVFARDGPVFLLGGPHVPEERPVRRLALIGIADRFDSRRGRRGRERQKLREGGRDRPRENDGQKESPGESARHRVESVSHRAFRQKNRAQIAAGSVSL